MPYVKPEDYAEAAVAPKNPGELNYAITMLVIGYLGRRGTLNYGLLNEVVGAVECCKQEFIRRVVNPYEDSKMFQNGDVYPKKIAPTPKSVETARIGAELKEIARRTDGREQAAERGKEVLAETKRRRAGLLPLPKHGGQVIMDEIAHQKAATEARLRDNADSEKNAACAEGVKREALEVDGTLTDWGFLPSPDGCVAFGMLLHQITTSSVRSVDVRTGIVKTRNSTYLLDPYSVERMADIPSELRVNVPVSQPPKSQQPQRDVGALVQALEKGKPIEEALDLAEEAAHHSDSAHGAEFPIARAPDPKQPYLGEDLPDDGVHSRDCACDDCMPF